MGSDMGYMATPTYIMMPNFLNNLAIEVYKVSQQTCYFKPAIFAWLH